MLPSSAQKTLKVFLEATQWAEAGEVVLRSGTETGRVFFAGGKIAWATASSVKRTFTAYLTEVASLKEEEVKEVFEECKRSGKNFGETIVEWGLVSEETLRGILLHQVADCLLEVFAWPSVEAMFMPERRAYKGTLTFALDEVLAKVIELDHEKRLPFHDLTVPEVLDSVQRMSGELEGLSTKPHLPALTPEGSPRKKPRRGVFLLLLTVALLASAGTSFLLWDKFLSRSPDEGTAASGVGVDAGAGGADAGLRDTGAGGPDAATGGPTTPGSPIADAGIQDAADAGSPVDQEVPRPIPEGIVAFAPGQGEGGLKVTSQPPKAAIYLDGVATGKSTPVTLKGVAAGREHVVLLERKGFLPAVKRVELSAGKTATVALKLARKGKPWKGRRVVRFETDPSGAEVRVDGKTQTGTTPMEVDLALVKPSKIEVRLSGYSSWSGSVRPAPDVDLSLFLRLTKQSPP